MIGAGICYLPAQVVYIPHFNGNRRFEVGFLTQKPGESAGLCGFEERRRSGDAAFAGWDCGGYAQPSRERTASGGRSPGVDLLENMCFWRIEAGTGLAREILFFARGCRPSSPQKRVRLCSLPLVSRCFCFRRGPPGQVEFQQVGQVHFEQVFVELCHLFRGDVAFVGGGLCQRGTAGCPGIFAR